MTASLYQSGSGCRVGLRGLRECSTWAGIASNVARTLPLEPGPRRHRTRSRPTYRLRRHSHRRRTRETIAARALGIVERRVGAAQHARDVLVAAQHLADADAAGAAEHPLGGGDDERSRRSVDSRCQRHGVEGGRFRDEQRELLAAEAADDVGFAADAAQHSGEGAQQLVARWMAELVL